MKRCMWCGAVFEEPYLEPAEDFMFNRFVHEVCPECGEDDFEDLEGEE